MRIRYTLLGRRQREDSAQTLGGSVSSVAALHVFGECTLVCTLTKEIMEKPWPGGRF